MKPPLLYLTHRIPYPPNKGDKLRSYHWLKALQREFRVYLGTFVDDPADLAHVDILSPACEDICIQRLHPLVARVRSLEGLVTGEPLSIPYYRSRRLSQWVSRVLEKEKIHHAVAFSGPMASYLPPAGILRTVIDFCDVDSAKWRDYASRHRSLMKWIYAREGGKLQGYEIKKAAEANNALFVTEAEARLFCQAAPDLAGSVRVVPNGVDADYFDPVHGGGAPYPDESPVIVFTGAMDYWPNIDGAVWFAKEVLPVVARRFPDIRFCIVGMNPARAVLDLASSRIVVTGTVPDIRPWLAHATLAVAPLRVARGVQNKVLEAMAMGKPIVTSEAVAAGLGAARDSALVAASDGTDFAEAVIRLLGDDRLRLDLAGRARATVGEHFSWVSAQTLFMQHVRGVRGA